MKPLVTMTMSIAILSAAAMADRSGGATARADTGGDTPRADTHESAPPYTVQDGDKVDQKTLDGWKTWRALACERCHGAEQEGLVGPSLVNSLKTLSKDEFHTTVINGRAEKGMPPWGASAMLQKNWEGLYAYLKGRSDGTIKPGHLHPLPQQ